MTTKSLAGSNISLQSMHDSQLTESQASHSKASSSSRSQSYNSSQSPPHTPSAQYATKTTYPDSDDEEESLTALEYDHGPRSARSHSPTSSSPFVNTLSRAQLSPQIMPRHERAFSMSGFNDFQRDMLPLAASFGDDEDGDSRGNSADGYGGSAARRGAAPKKSLSVVNGIALIISLQVGSGIFSSPGIIAHNTASPGASLIVWLASGLLAWTGASSFAELGAAIPLNGGAQAYLQYAYGDLVSWLFAWTAITALKPGSNAVIALIFGEYVNRIFYHATSSPVSSTTLDEIPQWAIKLTATGAVVVVTLLCVATRKLGSRAVVVFTAVKIGCLIAIPIMALVTYLRGHGSTTLSGPLFTGSSTSPSQYALALYSGLWAFDGWDQANYVGGEMKNPHRDIPRAIHASMLIVTILFLLANVSYFAVLDKVTVSVSNTVAMDFGRAVFGGPVGGTVFACMVAFSCFGSLNGSFYTSSHLVYAAARSRYLPALFGRLHSSRKTPLNATLLQSSLTLMYILVGGGFRSLINFAVVASWGFYFLTVLGVVVLRVKEPGLERPYKTWIITPLVFCAVAIFLLCMPVIASPVEAIAVLGFVLAGVPVFYLTQMTEDEQPRVFAWMTRAGRRIRSLLPGGTRASNEEGWEAVAMDEDGEGVEMGERR